MHEIELKFQVPPAQRAAVAAAVAGDDGATRTRLQAAYFDTAGRALARAGIALRIRREGRRWVQTLKAAGDDGLTRAEHNVDLPADHRPGTIADPQRHAGTPAGERALAALAEASAPLAEVFRTDIHRRTRTQRTRFGTVEIAFDEGRLTAGARHATVCELEVELKTGSPRAVLAAAGPWVRRHGLWLDTRSKAERGDLLARGETQAPPRKAGPVAIEAGMTLAQGARAVLASCLDQVSVNASQVADGEYDAEHVHQLRVGLRRLRTALRLFDDAFGAAPRWHRLADDAAWLFRALGAARDRVAIARPMEQELGEALQAAGLHFKAPAVPLAREMRDPAELVRSARAQGLLLALLGAVHAQAWPLAPGIERDEVSDFLMPRLRRWHRRARKQAAQGEALDDASRHQLRKRIKRLRYGMEFAQSLFKRRRFERGLGPLEALQDSLGELVDLTLALGAYRAGSADDPHALFAVGWLTARKERLLREGRPAMRAFARSRFRRLATPRRAS
jgi:inorganic triphosphatase YgiF